MAEVFQQMSNVELDVVAAQASDRISECLVEGAPQDDPKYVHAREIFRLAQEYRQRFAKIERACRVRRDSARWGIA